MFLGPHTEATKAKISAAKIGKPQSPEHRAKVVKTLIGNTRMAGKPMPDAVRAKVSAALIGKAMPPHTKEALLRANTGRKKSAAEIARRQATRAARAKIGA